MRNRHQMWVRWQGGSSCQSSTPALISTENQNSRMTSWLFRWCHTFSWVLVTDDLWGNHLHKLEKYGLTGKIQWLCLCERSEFAHTRFSLNAVFVECLWVMWAAQRDWRRDGGASFHNKAPVPPLSIRYTQSCEWYQDLPTEFPSVVDYVIIYFPPCPSELVCCFCLWNIQHTEASSWISVESSNL